jgi:hypothetical protein
MQHKQNAITSLLKLSLYTFLALGALAQVRADDKKVDPTGTWTWTTPGRNGGPDRKMTLKLKVDTDGKLNGTLSSPGRDNQVTETKIEDGKITGEEFSFAVTREFQGNKRVTKYSAKIVDGKIKGSFEFERNGEPTKRDWSAEKDTAGK